MCKANRLMISHDEIDAAAQAGILTPDQSSELKIFAAERKRIKVVDADEPFKFLSGFRDFFIAVGLLLLAAAFVSAAAFTKSGLVASALGAVAAWGMAELVARKDRLSLSSIIVSLGFVTATGLFAGFALDSDWLDIWSRRAVFSSEGFSSTGYEAWIDPGLGAALAAVAAGAGFYARFKVPFVLAGLAGTLILFVLTALESVAADWTRDNMRFILGAAGVITFLAAMRFDISDRARITRRADCGFWLHLIAAPLIVHSFVGAVGSSGLSIEISEAPLVFALVALITAVALVIDRRSMIVSALIYTAAATFVTVSEFEGSSDLPIVVTLFALAALVIGLGLLWPVLRRIIMTPFEGTRLADMVPPWRPQHITGTNA